MNISDEKMDEKLREISEELAEALTGDTERLADTIERELRDYVQRLKLPEDDGLSDEVKAESNELERERWSDEDFGMHEPKEGQDVVEALKEMHDDRDYEFRVTEDE